MLYMLAADVSCGENLKIPYEIVKIIQTIYFLIQVAVPILLILYGMWDLGKSVMSQKEDEIKKGQQVFIKRLIAAGLVFLVFTISRFVIEFVAKLTPGNQDFWGCAQDILGTKSDKNKPNR